MQAPAARSLDHRDTFPKLLIFDTDEDRCVRVAEISPTAADSRSSHPRRGERSKKRISILIMNDRYHEFHLFASQFPSPRPGCRPRRRIPLITGTRSQGFAQMRHEIHRIEALTWVEATAAIANSVAILPIGAIEAHGPHLPLNTDLLISEEVARRAADALISERPVVILPSIAYGVSYVGTCFAGTTPTPPQALTQTINEVLVTTLDGGASAAIIVNSHLEPAHIAAVTEARERAAGASQKPVAFPDIRDPRWSSRLSQEFRNGMRHAGAYETSLILAAYPDRVRQDLLPTLEPVQVDLPAALKAGARYFDEAGGALGYFGDPATATAEEGEKMFAALVSIVLDALAERES